MNERARIGFVLEFEHLYVNFLKPTISAALIFQDNF